MREKGQRRYAISDTRFRDHSHLSCFERIGVAAADTLTSERIKFWGFGIDCGLKVFCKRRNQRPWNQTDTGRRRSVALADQRAFSPYSCMRKCYSRSHQEHERLLLKTAGLSLKSGRRGRCIWISRLYRRLEREMRTQTGRQVGRCVVLYL